MRSKEFLIDFLKSIRSGRLHKLLRLILVILLLFFSYKVSISIFNYWLHIKAELSITKRNLTWDFNWRTGKLSIKADYFFFKSPELSGEFYKPDVDISVYESLKEFRPVLSFLRFEDGKVIIRNTGRKKNQKFSFRFPFVVKEFEIGQLLVVWGNLKLRLSSFIYNPREIACRGIWGSFKGKEFSVGPFSGLRKGGSLVVPAICFNYGDSRIVGQLEIASLDRWKFSGGVFSGVFVGKLIVKNYGKLEINWNGTTKNTRTEGKGIIHLRKKSLVIEKLEGNVDGANFSISGKVSRSLELDGEVQSPCLTFEDLKAENLKLSFKCRGSIQNPRINFTGTAETLDSRIAKLVSVSLTGEIAESGGRVVWKSRNTSGNLVFDWKFKDVNGKLTLKGFDIFRFKPIEFYRKHYGSWIPHTVLSGMFAFSSKEKHLTYRGSLSLNRFTFRSFSASGNLTLSGSEKELKFTGNLKGTNGGFIYCQGDINLADRRINSSYKINEVPVENFDFLKNAGLSGTVNGRGNVWGLLKNPEGNFSFSSSFLSFRNVTLGRTKGNLTLDNYTLSINALSEIGSLNNLKIKLKKETEILAEGRVNIITGKEAEELLKSFRIHLPFKFEGNGSGNFYVYFKNSKTKRNLNVKIEVTEFSGRFLYKDLEIEGDSSGRVEYLNGKIYTNFEGHIDRAIFKGVPLKNGKFRVLLNNNTLSISIDRISYEGIKSLNNQIYGNIFINLKKHRIEGKGRINGKYIKKNLGRISGNIDFLINGKLSQFIVNFSGILTLNSKLIERGNINVKGSILEPQNLGTISFSGKGTDVKLIINKDNWQAVGVVRNVVFKTQQVKVKVNMAYINLDVRNLTGMIAIPTFKLFYGKFYPLYSVSGIYINLNGGNPEISDVTLSYIDGWVKLEKLKLNGSISGNLEAQVGLKGLVYLARLKPLIPYARNSLRIKGQFKYSKNMHYRIEVDGKGVEFKGKYLLNKAVVNSLDVRVRNGLVENASGEISIGGGTVLIEGNGTKLSATASMIPIGEINKWKGLISGNVDYSKKGIVGNLTISKAKIILKKEKFTTKNESSFSINTPVNINILFDQPLQIEGNLFNLTVVPKLWIRNINSRPIIGGTFYVTNGKINYMGKIFKIVYGTGTIENLKEGMGNLNILASTYISGYYIYMKIEGKMNNLTVYLTSDPPLTREQILNLIMTGASPEEIEASSELFPAVQVAYYATASLFKPFEAKFKKTLKLESFSIEPYITKYGETVAKLSIVKRLARRIRLTGYGTTGQNPEYGGSVQFFIKENYYLELRYNTYYGLEAGIGFEVNRK